MITLREYLTENGCEEGLRELIELTAMQAVPIRNAFIGNLSYAETKNISGEQQAALDKWADRHLTDVFRASGRVASVASEEQDEICSFDSPEAEYSVVMDPLDGSSLIQVNLAVGTIVGIYRGRDVLRKGEELAAAFYMLYGPMTVLTLTWGEGVHTFALSQDSEYVLLEENIQMPEGKLYGSGGLKKDWTECHEDFISHIEGKGGKLRYSGSFVADFHQILKYGGVYCYPAVKGKTEGKLRLLFEGNPIGFIARQAGGAISDGHTSLLTIQPRTPHQKTPLYVGSREIIEKAEAIIRATE